MRPEENGNYNFYCAGHGMRMSEALANRLYVSLYYMHLYALKFDPRWTFLTGTKTIVPLGDVAAGYVGNILSLMSALAKQQWSVIGRR